MRPAAWLALAGLLFVLALTFKPVIENDGIGYFSYLHTLVVDHDLDFTNEYQAVRTEHVGYYPLPCRRGPSTEWLAASFPVGAAIVSLPVSLVTPALHPSGEPQFGPPFSVTLTLVSLLMGLLALVLAYRLASAIVTPRPALIGVAAAALATPFIYYLVYEPSYSHTFSACAVSAFLYVWWWRRDRRSALGWFALGVLGGLMGLIRYHDGPLLLIGLLDKPRRWWHLLPFLAGVLVAFAPQLPIDQVLFGSLLPARPAGQDLQFFPRPHPRALFSRFPGPLCSSPVPLLSRAAV